MGGHSTKISTHYLVCAGSESVPVPDTRQTDRQTQYTQVCYARRRQNFWQENVTRGLCLKLRTGSRRIGGKSHNKQTRYDLSASHSWCDLVLVLGVVCNCKDLGNLTFHRYFIASYQQYSIYYQGSNRCCWREEMSKFPATITTHSPLL